MDAPDPVVRSAMAKVMNPQGLPPMTQKELNRLLNRQYLESEDRRIQAANTSLQTSAMRGAIDAGVVSPIDVRGYTGSMYAAPGSYAAARAGSDLERKADLLLQQRFGKMQPGEVRYADTYGSGSISNLPALMPTAQAPAGQVIDEIQGGVGDSAIERLLGRNLAAMGDAKVSEVRPAQPALPLQGETIPTASNVFSFTPAARAQQMAQLQFDVQQADALRRQQEKLRQQTLDTLSSMAAMGRDINQYRGAIPDDIIIEATARGAKMAKDIAPAARVYPSLIETVENGIVYQQRQDTSTGEAVGDKVPIRRIDELPGTAKPQSTGQLVPVIDATTQQPIPDLYFDPVTKQMRSGGSISPKELLLMSAGFGNFPTSRPVKTIDQIRKEILAGKK